MMKTKKEVKVEETFIIKIYLKGIRRCKFKSVPLTEEEVDQFYNELLDDRPIMEFGTFYFAKSDFKYAIAKLKLTKIKA